MAYRPKVAAPKHAKMAPGFGSGTTALNGFDKVMFALAGIEVLWGAMILVLGVVALVFRNDTPVLQLVVGWAVVVLLVSVLGAQALSRPIYRRARMTNDAALATGDIYSALLGHRTSGGCLGRDGFSQLQPDWVVTAC